MEKKKPQTMRYDEQELALIKSVFAESEDLIKAVRKVFWQHPLDAVEQSLISVNLKGGILKILRKTFLPTLDGNAPLHQVIDLWMTVELKDKLPDEATSVIRAREMVIAYLDQILKGLEGQKVSKGIKFSELSDVTNKLPMDAYVDLTARNTIIQHVEMQLMALTMLAGLKDETPEETQKRLAKDSSK